MSGVDEDELREVHDRFRQAVTMTPKELEQWLDSDEARSVGATSSGTKSDPGGEESTGHEMGRRIVGLLRKGRDEMTDDDVARMRKVAGYVARHTAQGPPKDDVEHSRWRYSLMNWGHDPLKG